MDLKKHGFTLKDEWVEPKTHRHPSYEGEVWVRSDGTVASAHSSCPGWHFFRGGKEVLEISYGRTGKRCHVCWAYGMKALGEQMWVGEFENGSLALEKICQLLDEL